MAKYELLIACASKYNPDFKEEGDIIAVRPHPFNWGKTSRLIVIIEANENLTTMQGIYEFPLYEGGLDIEPSEDIIAILPKILKKNRFQIPYDIIKNGWLSTLDLKKVRSRLIIYQPLKEANLIIDTNEKVSIIWDKHKQSFKYTTLKVAKSG